MKLILGKDIQGAKIFHTDHEKEKTTVQDILLDTESWKLSYLTLRLKTPTHEIDEDKDRGFLELLNPFKDPEGMEKLEYLIPEKQIDRIEAGSVIMLGTKVEEERERPLINYQSYNLLKDFKIETESGESIGKINDMVIDAQNRAVVGLQLSEGSWGGGTKYLPFQDNISWGLDKIIVNNQISKQLVEEPALLA